MRQGWWRGADVRPYAGLPVISDGRVYVRNQDTLLVYDIKAAR